MSALEPPAEVLLVALFDAADGAEATARALLHSGLDTGRVAVLARDIRGTVFGAVPRGAVLRSVASWSGACSPGKSPPARSVSSGGSAPRYGASA